MATRQISLDEASWRLEQSRISGRAFAELLVKSPPLLLGLSHDDELRDSVDLSGMTSVRLEPDNIIIANDLTWMKVQVKWDQLRTSFQKRGQPVSWSFAYDITAEMLERSRRADGARPRLDDLRPRPRVYLPELMRSAQGTAPPPRRASRQWFAEASYKRLVPASGKAPPGKRGPKSRKRENAADAMRKDLSQQIVNVDTLRAMPEKNVADRYGVSRDTARKARFDVLQSFVENSTSTNDK